ncbi:hypothetical protein [Roseofilum sp. Guam]|uniref:hypothetical protein n=1 Tax=Roseofilum sp. Guam TaxID=2821502 RepID=UPI001AFF4B3A|nr:hypothetical protein [Roseofilum sp. Guam]MBP0031268.1 hypothetical protein [Roseofilum sp. Guam]
MSKSQEKRKGCGCFSIPISVIILCLGLGYGLFTQRHRLPQLLNNPEIDSILLFSLEKPDKFVTIYHELVAGNKE